MKSLLSLKPRINITASPLMMAIMMAIAFGLSSYQLRKEYRHYIVLMTKKSLPIYLIVVVPNE